MNKEIKEILHLLKRCNNTYLKIENSNGEKEYEYHQVNDLRLDGYHSQLLLDYITNLQKENVAKTHQIEVLEEILNYERNIRNDKLQQENKELNRMCELYSKSLYNAELTDYKSRCEGTINLIDRTIEIIKQQPTKDDSWILSRLYGFKYALNGSDENDS